MLNDNLYCEEEVIMDMAQRMKRKFDKYWKEYSVVLAFEAILDPCLKLEFLEFMKIDLLLLKRKEIL